jgi:hypothetical protein
MNRAGLTALLAAALVASVFAQQDRKLAARAGVAPAVAGKKLAPGRTPAWSAEQMVSFKGEIRGIQQSAPLEDGKSWTSLLVKLPNGGTALVDLGPSDFVAAHKLNLKLRDTIQVTGAKVLAPNGDSIVLAQKLEHKGSKPVLRNAEGKPFWR